jgi:hypothetical protein
MLKYLLVSLMLALPLSVSVGTQSAEAGLFANKPVRTFFQNRKPVRKLLKAAARVAVAPVKVFARVKPVRSALGLARSSGPSAGCNCVDCQCVDCNCGTVSSGCANCGTEN